MPTWRPRKRASASSSRALNAVPLTTTSPLSGRSSPAITIRSVDFPDPDGPIRPIASPDPTRKLISFRICTRAAPEPSERLTFLIAMVSGSVQVKDEVSMRLSMVRSYGNLARGVEGSFASFAHIIVLFLAFLMTDQALAQTPVAAPAKPLKIVAFGDSLTAGLGLPANQAFPVRL